MLYLFFGFFIFSFSLTLIEEKLQQQITQETHLVVINVVVCFVSVSVDGTHGEWTVAGCPRCCCLGSCEGRGRGMGDGRM